jgi:hypothetical protein
MLRVKIKAVLLFLRKTNEVRSFRIEASLRPEEYIPQEDE